MVLKEAKIRDEAELEALLVKDPNQIEENFQILTQQRETSGSKGVAILGVDSGRILTLIELKANVDGNQLQQALEYYDWLMEQGIDWIADAYRERFQGAILKDQMPQIFLIAPDFDDKSVKEAKYIRTDIKIRIFKYLALEINGNKEIKLIEKQIPEVRGIETKPRIKGNKEVKLIETPTSPVRGIETKPKMNGNKEVKLNEAIKECVGEELYKQLKIISNMKIK
jgi:hypothetical protein